MDRKDILARRLSECNSDYNDIISYVEEKIDGKYEILTYISQFDGVGNKDSDFDIYVITDKKYQYSVEMTKIKSLNCDIEYWEISELEKIVDSVDSKNYKHLKLLKKMSRAIEITLGDEFPHMTDFLQNLNIDELIYSYYKSLSNAEYDDAVKMYNNKEYVACLCCCQRTVNYWIASVNAKNNKANINLKWANKIFIENNGYETETLDEYLKTFIFVDITANNIEQILCKMMDFISNYNNVSLF